MGEDGKEVERSREWVDKSDKRSIYGYTIRKSSAMQVNSKQNKTMNAHT